MITDYHAKYSAHHLDLLGVTYCAGYNCDSGKAECVEKGLWGKAECVEKGLWETLHIMLQED